MKNILSFVDPKGDVRLQGYSRFALGLAYSIDEEPFVMESSRRLDEALIHKKSGVIFINDFMGKHDEVEIQVEKIKKAAASNKDLTFIIVAPNASFIQELHISNARNDKIEEFIKVVRVEIEIIKDKLLA